MKRETFWSLNTLLLVALLLALASSLGHVAYAFSTVNGGNMIEAYISAVAIDLGLLALGGGISQRKTQGRTTWQLWSGIGFFSLISVYGNWLAGINHVQEMNVSNLAIAQWLVSLRPVLLSGVLPISVIYLAEIVSGNYEVQRTTTQPQGEAVQQSVATSSAKAAQRKPKAKRKPAKPDKETATLALFDGNGATLRNAEISKALKENPSTTSRRLKKMVDAGTLQQTADGFALANGQPTNS